MKVLHLVDKVKMSGAGKAAYRLHQGLSEISVDSDILVNSNNEDHQNIIGPPNKFADISNKVKGKLDRLPLFSYPERDKAPYSVQFIGGEVRNRINDLEPNIINLHNWTLGGYLSINDLKRLKTPLVWSLHDMWPFTGGCHYDAGCGRYVDFCGSCPKLASNRENDLSRWTWNRKNRAWKNSNITVVGLSTWLTKCAKESSLFSGYRIENIPNGIDTDVFKPIDKKKARAILNLPDDKSLILFSAIGPTTNPRKGFDLLKNSIEHLFKIYDNKDIEIIVVGEMDREADIDLLYHTWNLGFFHDDVSLRLIYSAADVFVAPSRQDNLPNTVMEALACGTPCVSFNIGGMPDMIEKHKNGFLAEPFSTANFAEGIKWVLEDKDRLKDLSSYARKKCVSTFSDQSIANRYLSLYQDIIRISAND